MLLRREAVRALASVERLLLHPVPDRVGRSPRDGDRVGPVVALTAIAVFADVHRFASAKHVASYAGLVPSTYQPGACDRRGHITKRGSAPDTSCAP